MKYGFVLTYGDARRAAELAREAEQAGWDGFFVWEPIYGYDAWVMLAAAAMVTERIRLGTMITPLSRMRPWKLASETLTLDHLSNGRVILSVGLGALDTGFAAYGEETERKTRAELLDEGLEIVTELWKGKPFRFEGKHYSIEAGGFIPPPPAVQQPRIPIWVVGAWKREKSLRRALRFDGLLPNKINLDGSAGKPEPEDVRLMRAYVDEHIGPGNAYDIIVEGTTPGDNPRKAAAEVRPWAEAGATWWIEADWTGQHPDLEAALRSRLRQGPPRMD